MIELLALRAGLQPTSSLLSIVPATWQIQGSQPLVFFFSVLNIV
ncbi:unnamed protein product [Larinioides sclopetarius]|uniref:Uncharacterized protein n=1 Tax=Larinioides sclopetarius TaxID=280406 RepID=A0AAV1Z4I2_9ARAC